MNLEYQNTWNSLIDHYFWLIALVVLNLVSWGIVWLNDRIDRPQWLAGIITLFAILLVIPVCLIDFGVFIYWIFSGLSEASHKPGGTTNILLYCILMALIFIACNLNKKDAK